MKQLESNFLNMVLVLTIITLVAAGALGGVYTLTQEPIQKSKNEKKESAIKEVLPPFTRLADSEMVNELPLVKAYDGDQFVGAAIETTSAGFGGTIRIMVGFDTEGKIVNYSVLEQTETPGLGTKMVDWFKTNVNRQSVLGVNPEKVNFTVSKDGGDIDGITAATISSRAFLQAIQKAYAAYAGNENSDATSGASQQIETTDGQSHATDLAENVDGESGATQPADSSCVETTNYEQKIENNYE